MDWNIVGHEWAIALLEKQLLQKQVRHAYLFVGPKGIGRRTLALRLAQAINCPEKGEYAAPCGSCRTCRQIESMAHVDLTVVQPEGDGSSIKVEQIRDLQHVLSRSPYENAYRVGLLLNFESATLTAQNSLLKTLEEAPSKAVLLLTADSTENLLPTIVSRCEIIRLRSMSPEALSVILQQRFSIQPQEAGVISHISGGRVGEALRYASDEEFREARIRWMDDLVQLLKQGQGDRLDYAEKRLRYAGRNGFESALKVWLSFWRDVTVHAAGNEFPLINIDYQDFIHRCCVEFGMQTAREQLSHFQDALQMAEDNVNQWMSGEILLLDMPVLEETTSAL